MLTERQEVKDRCYWAVQRQMREAVDYKLLEGKDKEGDVKVYFKMLLSFGLESLKETINITE